jgi:hypothetical protein
VQLQCSAVQCSAVPNVPSQRLRGSHCVAGRSCSVCSVPLPTNAPTCARAWEIAIWKLLAILVLSCPTLAAPSQPHSHTVRIPSSRFGLCVALCRSPLGALLLTRPPPCPRDAAQRPAGVCALKSLRASGWSCTQSSFCNRLLPGTPRSERRICPPPSPKSLLGHVKRP